MKRVMFCITLALMSQALVSQAKLVKPNFETKDFIRQYLPSYEESIIYCMDDVSPDLRYADDSVFRVKSITIPACGQVLDEETGYEDHLCTPEYPEYIMDVPAVVSQDTTDALLSGEPLRLIYVARKESTEFILIKAVII